MIGPLECYRQPVCSLFRVNQIAPPDSPFVPIRCFPPDFQFPQRHPVGDYVIHASGVCVRMDQSIHSFAVHFEHEPMSNEVRTSIASHEPHSLRTFTPSQAVLARSAGVFHWTPEGRRLFDFTSGLLVANLGHNPPAVAEAICRLPWLDS